MIDRILQQTLEEQLFNGKLLLITGPRQVGKSTLLGKIESVLSKKVLFLNCDEPDVRELLKKPTSSQLKNLIGSAEVVMIDEAQRVKDIGITLKLAFDNLPNVQFIVTGSSALELANEINEPLTGRKFEYHLYPLSIKELVNHNSLLEAKRNWQHYLLYGLYPDVINQKGNEKEVLKNLTDSYLYKDVFNFQEVRKPEIFDKLLKALALQLGSEVSYNELAKAVGSDIQTVQRYLDLLEKTFIVFRLHSFSRNVRNELKKSRKVYFYDNGVRNAIINNYQPIELRHDKGVLWENFLVAERMKFNHYRKLYTNNYFWRTSQQQEIDYVEEYDGILHAYEFKINPKTKTKFPTTFLSAYPDHELSIVNPDNFLEFLT